VGCHNRMLTTGMPEYGAGCLALAPRLGCLADLLSSSILVVHILVFQPMVLCMQRIFTELWLLQHMNSWSGAKVRSSFLPIWRFGDDLKYVANYLTPGRGWMTYIAVRSGIWLWNPVQEKMVIDIFWWLKSTAVVHGSSIAVRAVGTLCASSFGENLTDSKWFQAPGKVCDILGAKSCTTF